MSPYDTYFCRLTVLMTCGLAMVSTSSQLMNFSRIGVNLKERKQVTARKYKSDQEKPWWRFFLFFTVLPASYILSTHVSKFIMSQTRPIFDENLNHWIAKWMSSER